MQHRATPNNSEAQMMAKLVDRLHGAMGFVGDSDDEL